MNRFAPYTTVQLYRWVRPKGNPMSDVIDDPNEPENEDDENEEEEEDEDDEDEPEAWETDNGIVFELHSFEDHDEVLVYEEPEDGKEVEKDVAIALSLEDLDEAIEVLKEIREKMAEKETARSPVARIAPAAKTPKPKLAKKP